MKKIQDNKITTPIAYTVLLCIDYDEKLLRRYHDLLKGSEIQGGAITGSGTLYISKRTIRISEEKVIPYNLILALGGDDGTDIAKRIYEEGGEIAVGFFDMVSSSPEYTFNVIRQVRKIFPKMICAVATKQNSTPVCPSDLFPSPSEWLYFQNIATQEEMEQLVCHLITSFVLHREKEIALAINEASQKGLRKILNASPELLKAQPENELIKVVLDNLVSLTQAKNTFLLNIASDGNFKYMGGTGEFITEEKFVASEFNSKEKLFRSAMLKKKVSRVKEGLLAPLIIHEKEIGLLYIDHQEEITRDTELLEVFAQHIAFAIENSLMQAEILYKRALEHELALASKIQKHLLPRDIPTHPDLEVYGQSIPAKEIGGDYFDFIPEREPWRGLYMCIGDVSGKGVPAALIMSEVRSILRSLTLNPTNSTPFSPKELLLNTARILLKDIEGSGRFVSMIVLKWDADLQTLLYSGAGHEHILVMKTDSKVCEATRCGGVVLGIDFKNFQRLVQEEEIKLNSGDMVVLFTDGITEARNSENEMFKLDRLKRCIARYRKHDVKDIVTAILKELQEFVGNTEQTDDITLVAFRKK